MPTVYKSKYNEPIKINDFSLIKFQYPVNDNHDFIKVNYSDLGGNGYHYMDSNSDLSHIVWDRGSSNYYHRLNYNYIQGYLYTPQENNLIEDLNFIDVEFFIPQLFDWSTLYGIMISIKGVSTDDIYINKILRINDFKISSSREIMYGVQWAESYSFKIPLSDEELYIQTTEISNEDVSINGLLYNYPNEYVPLIQNKPLPDYIKTKLNFDELGFLHLLPYTLENKTLENSIKDYFGYDRDKIISIDISHIISYSGTNNQSGEFEEDSIRVSNEENNFNECVVGLNLQKFFDMSDPEHSFNINVRTEIIVDGKIMNRYSSITTDFGTDILKIKKELQKPTSLIFQEVKENNIINQTVIEKPKELKIVKVYQNVFVKYIDNDISYSNTDISFTNLTEPGYMIVGDDIIKNKQTIDGVYYFDLSELTPITSDTEYKLFISSNDKMIGNGKILKI